MYKIVNHIWESLYRKHSIWTWAQLLTNHDVTQLCSTCIVVLTFEMELELRLYKLYVLLKSVFKTFSCVSPLYWGKHSGDPLTFYPFKMLRLHEMHHSVNYLAYIGNFFGSSIEIKLQMTYVACNTNILLNKSRIHTLQWNSWRCAPFKLTWHPLMEPEKSSGVKKTDDFTSIACEKQEMNNYIGWKMIHIMQSQKNTTCPIHRFMSKYQRYD